MRPCRALLASIIADALTGQGERNDGVVSRSGEAASRGNSPNAVADALRKGGWHVATAELGYRGKDPVVLAGDERAKVEAFLERLDENDDVHRVWAALK